MTHATATGAMLIPRFLTTSSTLFFVFVLRVMNSRASAPPESGDQEMEPMPRCFQNDHYRQYEPRADGRPAPSKEYEFGRMGWVLTLKAVCSVDSAASLTDRGGIRKYEGEEEQEKDKRKGNQLRQAALVARKDSKFQSGAWGAVSRAWRPSVSLVLARPNDMTDSNSLTLGCLVCCGLPPKTPLGTRALHVSAERQADVLYLQLEPKAYTPPSTTELTDNAAHSPPTQATRIHPNSTTLAADFRFSLPIFPSELLAHHLAWNLPARTQRTANSSESFLQLRPGTPQPLPHGTYSHESSHLALPRKSSCRLGSPISTASVNSTNSPASFRARANARPANTSLHYSPYSQQLRPSPGSSFPPFSSFNPRTIISAKSSRTYTGRESRQGDPVARGVPPLSFLSCRVRNRITANRLSGTRCANYPDHIAFRPSHPSAQTVLQGPTPGTDYVATHRPSQPAHSNSNKLKPRIQSIHKPHVDLRWAGSAPDTEWDTALVQCPFAQPSAVLRSFPASEAGRRVRAIFIPWIIPRDSLRSLARPKVHLLHGVLTRL
ncbi:hypothetical protein B0H17DRAFT_1123632 [Mycena rosella]|uniref:Uncharacterized protein n=1 Tax=Mycena rosella TaxID=1033263 RepID=A0AAD7H210_MYCRO|nr:hypothetical protein B0H17DRAFT_1123632 [Mycena rosella]